MPTQNVAINLSIKHTQEVVNGITAITLAWVEQGRSITKNYLKMMEMLTGMVNVNKKVTESITDNTKEIEKSWSDVFNEIGDALDDVGHNSAETFGQIALDIKELIGKGGVAQGVGLTALVGALNSVGNAASETAGRFKALSVVGGIIGGIVGTLVGPGAGTLAGATLGAAIGNFVGGIGGALMDLPNKAFAVVSNVVKTVLGGVKQIGQGIVGIGTSLKNFIFGPLSLFGLGAASAFRTVTLGLKTSMNNVYEAAAAFQQLAISLDTLTRREIARSQGLDIMDDSLKDVSEHTRGLFSWLRKVSLTSPFTMSSIAHSLKFASAMGLSVKMTKELTLATGNFSAAMGLSDDHQERIMYNLAQIYQQGKLTGREFRDLAISFVPVYDILGIMADKAGMATEEFKKLALEGGVPVEEFFQTFVDYMNTNYADAMKKMSHTMVGVTNNIKDFIQVVLGMEMLGPVLDSISDRIATFLEQFMTPQLHRRAQDWGEGLARAFDLAARQVDLLGDEILRLLRIIGFSAPTFQDFATIWVKIYLNIKHAIRFISTVVHVITNAVKEHIMPAIRSLGGAQEESGSWGANLMKNFAMGLVAGAARFLARALLYIKAIIIAFFRGSSPPLIAPHMSQWGGALMDSFIGGMLADTNWGALAAVGDALQTGLNQVIGGQGGGGVGAGPAPEDNPQRDWEIWEAKGHGPEPDLGGGGGGIGSIASNIEAGLEQIVFFATEAGMRAAAEFMRGFGMADFDVLDAVQNPLKSALDALVGLGMMEQVDSLEMFYNFSQDLIAALDEFNRTGQISASLLDEISQLGMNLGPELADLVSKEFDLATAIKAAEAAQERLNASIKAMNEAGATARRTVNEYNAMLRAGASRQVLKAKLAEVNAAEKAYGAAVRENIAAEENKRLADERVEQLREIAELQSKLVENMIELLNAQASAISTAKGGGADDITEPWKQAIEDLGDMELDLPAFDWEAEEKKWEEDIAKFTDDLIKKFNDEFKAEFFNIDTQQAAEDFAEGLRDNIFKFLGIEFDPTGESGSAWQQLVNNMGDGIRNVSFAEIGDAIVEKFRENWEVLTIIALATIIGGPGWGIIAGLAVVGIRSAVDKHPGLGKLLVGMFTGNFAMIALGLGEILSGTIAAGAQNLGTWAADTFDKLFPPDAKITIPVVPQIDMGSATVPTNFSPFVPPIGGYTFAVPVSINAEPLTISPTPQETGESMTTGAQEGILIPPWDAPFKEWLKKIWEAIKEVLHISSPAKEFNEAGEAITLGVQEGVLKPDWLTTLSDLVSKIWSAIKTAFGMSSPAKAFNDAGTGIVDGIIDGVKNQIDIVTRVGGAISTQLERIVDAFKDVFGIDEDTAVGNPFINIGEKIMEGIKKGIENLKDAILRAIEDLGLEMPAWLAKLLGESSPSKVFEAIGENAMLGLEGGLRDKFSVVKDILEKQAKDMPGLMYGTIGTRQMRYQPYSTMAAKGITTRNTNVSFGDIYLSNGMDWAIFKEQVHRAIVED